MKHILSAALVLCMALMFFACGEALVFNSPSDLPEGTETLVITEADQSGGAYYVKAQAGGQSYTFKLADDFVAMAFEPGTVGAIYMLDYNSPEDFYSRWYLLAKEHGGLGTVFSFAFAGGALVSLKDPAQPPPPDGPPMQGTSLPEGVEYVEEYELQSDPGDNMSAEGAAAALFSAIVLLHDDFYTPGDAVAITLTGLETVDGEDAYLYTILLPDGSESKHAVNYRGDVYVLQGDDYMLIFGDGPSVTVTNAEDAEVILNDAIHTLTQEMAANGPIALVAKGEDTVNGQNAWLFDLGADLLEKFVAEYHFAVTDNGEVLVMDIQSGGDYVPHAVG
ncbi:MAG: hypothetical protein FWH26_07835 [Oscillospiraceae bacterium]|nr:hypothetical protein [Oscillospiraceae bacterium]